MDKKITVVYVEDLAPYQQTMKFILEQLAPDIAIVDTALTGQIGVEKILARRPDIAIIDMKLADNTDDGSPPFNGNRVVEAVLKQWPEARILIYTNQELYNQTAFALVRALSLGVGGILFKPGNPDEIVRTIRDVAAGMRILPAEVNKYLNNDYWKNLNIDGIMPFDKECGAYLAYGYSYKKIARAMERYHKDVSDKKVRDHLHNLYAKLGTEGRVDTAILIQALQHVGEWPSPPPLDDDDLDNNFE
jgi:DNA-binding NarL/FixJ family response regulator